MRSPLVLLSLSTLLLATTAVAAEPTAPSTGAGAPRPTWAPEEIIVTGTRRDTFAARDSAAATRTATPLIRVPQSIQVLTRTLLEEQDQQTLSDALRNISGVTPARTSELVLINPSIRGFDAEIFLDGLPAFGSTPTVDPGSLVNAERVEVAKGPSSTLFGGGLGAPLGGIINVVSKTPTREPGGSVTLRGGSFATLSAAADVNQPVADRIALRLTADYETADSHIDDVERERYGVYPALSAQLGERTELVLRGQFTGFDQLEYSGLPAAITVGSQGLLVPRDRFSGAPDAPLTEIRNDMVSASLTHGFTDSVTGTVLARWYRNSFEEYGSFIFPGFFPPAAATPTVYPLLKAYLPSEVEQRTVHANLQAELAHGSVRHTLLAGVEVDDTDYFARIGFDFNPIGLIDYRNPASDPAFGAVPVLTRTQDDDYSTTAAFVQDQVSIGERLHLLAGLRWSQAKLDQAGEATDATYHRLSPRLGATVDVAEGVALFAGWSEGFRMVSGFFGIETPVPETSTSYEGGLKLAMDDIGLSGTLALFELTRRNVAVGDPANPGFQIQTGEQRSRGIEADLVWEPTPSVSLLASYAYTDAEVTEDTTIPVGSRLRRTPEHAGRIAARYRVLDGALAGLGVGAGLTFVGRQEITLPNSFSVPAYETVDLQVSYEVDRWRLALSVVNLTDADYFDPYQYLNQPVVSPGQPLSAFVTLSASF
ncbi:MAG: hypothetical protein RLY86_1484 [Pseudomonadota bacterium]